MSALGPQPKDKVKLSRNVNFARSKEVKVVGSVQPNELPKGTKGVVDKVQGSIVTVKLDWNGDLIVALDKVHWANTFEDQSSSTSDKIKFTQKVKIDSKIKVLTKNATITEIPSGSEAKIGKFSGKKVVVTLAKPSVELEFELEGLLKVIKVI